jgi:plastocyanin
MKSDIALRITIAAAILGSACGGGSSTPTAPSSTPPSASAPAAAPITIVVTGQNGAQSFSPNPASAGGQVVVFRNADAVVHRVVLNDGGVDTGDIPPGGTSRAVTMPSAGANYHCSLHPGMIGTVRATDGVAPPCTGLYCDPNY